MVFGHPDRGQPGRNKGITAMRVRWSYCLGGIGVVALSLVIGLEVERATARPGSVSTTIDRTFKGDRLEPATPPELRPSMYPSMRPNLRPSVTPAGQLPDGCESSISTIRNSPVIGRCVAMAPAGRPGMG